MATACAKSTRPEASTNAPVMKMSIWTRSKNSVGKIPNFILRPSRPNPGDAEAGEYERLFPNWQKFSESKRDALRELVPVFAVCAANCVRIVNRLNYFLADGDKNELLTVTEIESDQHGYIERFWICNCDGSRAPPRFLPSARNQSLPALPNSQSASRELSCSSSQH